MTRSRFQEMKRFIHLPDNAQIDETDKMFKLRPLMKLLTESFQRWGIFHETLSIDKATIKYDGRHATKRFIRGKPIRFGYKNWVLSGADGYCYSFDTYCDAKTKADSNVKSTEDRLPLGSQVMMELLNSVCDPSDHVVLFDNFFSSYDLFVALKNQGFWATGTLRENRLRKCPILPAKELKKQE